MTRVSVDSSGVEGNDRSDGGILSADGRFVLFSSVATNLVGNDTNGLQDVFVHDRATGTTECVSVDPSGVPGNAASGGYFALCSISADGRVVAFVSDATNLVAGGATSGSQIFVRDRSTGITEIVSVDSSGVAGNDVCWNSALSADGRYVAFDSFATNLIGGDTNGVPDIFVRDRATEVTERVSVDSFGAQGHGDSVLPAISADGLTVSFSSFAADLVLNDKNRVEDAFVHYRSTGTTVRVSLDSSGVEGNGTSYAGWTSADGQIEVIASSASNLVPNDTNKTMDLFVRDRTSGMTERVSVDSAGGQANGFSSGLSISGDGWIVGFYSDASNLVAGDTNGNSDSFVHDRATGVTSRISVDSSGGEANGECWGCVLSADGRAASFASDATNLVSGDTNGFSDVFVRDDRLATWSNYGAGFPGTNGVPSFTASANPIVGATITLTLVNSRQQPTAGVVFAGQERAVIHSSWGGDLLVSPILILPISFSYGSDQFDWSIPLDFTLLGITLDLQAIEADPGAAKGVSFTSGLELTVGL